MATPIGSSPLARGTRRPPSREVAAPRFIPARAGNTLREGQGGNPASVHPRSRGEHVNSRPTKSHATGSSPLARGTRLALWLLRWIRRFIPARAGNTRDGPPRDAQRPVHPRSRGEHAPFDGSAGQSTGSSPLARGTQARINRAEGEDRFIPARAGNTTSAPSPPPSRPVHPRSRGEHYFGSVSAALQTGSSPLARGTLDVSQTLTRALRFIPARAGNTGASPRPTRASPVHPRSRGEHVQLGSPHRLKTGSSPLARGTLEARGLGHGERRFIPARAGNT